MQRIRCELTHKPHEVPEIPKRSGTSQAHANRFNRMEWAGAFGDLGTLIPFVVAYIAVRKMDSFGVLFSFGAAMVVCGAYYKTPFPVQPLKGIGGVAATQAAQTATITQDTVFGANLATGVIWLILGLTGAAKHISRLVPRPVVIGIVLGLGIDFMLQGIRWMSGGWLIAGIGLLGTVLLLSNKAIPAMFLLLIFGAVCGAYQNAEVLSVLSAAKIEFHLPSITKWHRDIDGLHEPR
jgi:xanthine/uracil/vitamin C permease (AzgA family)